MIPSVLNSEIILSMHYSSQINDLISDSLSVLNDCWQFNSKRIVAHSLASIWLNAPFRGWRKQFTSIRVKIVVSSWSVGIFGADRSHNPCTSSYNAINYQFATKICSAAHRDQFQWYRIEMRKSCLDDSTIRMLMWASSGVMKRFAWMCSPTETCWNFRTRREAQIKKYRTNVQHTQIWYWINVAFEI